MTWLLAAAATASAFNLSCVGTEYAGDGPGAGKDGVQRTYRVDLVSERYCSGDCTSTYPIAKIEQMTIYLARDAADATISNWVSINREDGQIISRFKMADTVFSYIGRCFPAPFAGFPTRKF